MSSSGSNTGKVTTSRPTADAWCVLEWDSSAKPNIVDSVGISAAAYVQTGVVRLFFTNPERFASGAYVVLGQQELGNAGGYGSITPQGSITSTSSVAVGLSGSCDVSVIGFNSASATSPTFATDTALNLRPRVNLAFFCMRSDNDIRKTGILNYGCDTQNMSVISPSGTSGGMQVVPGAAVAPDGTNTAVGIRVTANSLGTRKVIQYSIPSQFSVAGKAWNASIYIKAGDSGRVLRGASANVLFYDNSTGNSPSVRLNLDTGVTAASTGSTDYVNHSIQDAGNGWYRVNLCSRGGAPGQYAGKRNFYIGLSSNFAAFSGNETNWSGNGSIEAYLWGFQMEEGSVTTPYIPAIGAVNPNLSPAPGDQDRLTVYSPGSGGFGTDNRQNLLRYSQDFSNAQWGKVRIGVCGGYVAPDGTTTAFKLHELDPTDPNGTPYVAPDGKQYFYKTIRQFPIPFERGNLRQSYAFSVYAKAAERKYFTFADGGFGQFGNIVVDLENGTVTQNSQNWKVTTRNSGNGWWRIGVVRPLGSDNWDGINESYIGNASSFGFSPNPGATTSAPYGPSEPGVSGAGILVWGSQLERGTAIGDYTPTTNAVAGTTYGRTAGASDSALSNLHTRREASAYGTIVIPPSRTATGVPYLENAYGVKGVRAVNAGTYEVEFNPPMDTTGYCVLTSNEQETISVSEPTSGEGSIPHTSEYSMNVLRRVSGLDDQRRRNAFRVSCLRQPSEANNPNLITNSFATGNVLPSPMTWGAYEYTTTAVSVANESALSGGLRSAMIAVSPNWVKCVKNASGGRIAAGIPGGSNLTPGAYYRIKYYVVCDDQNFTGSNEIFCQSDNDASSDQVTRSSYVAGDKGTVRLIETFYRSVSGSNTMVLRASNSLPNGTALYITGVQVHRVMSFEPRGDFYQAGREQRINFMVFGGRSIYGSE